MIRESDAAYIAGLFDGECSIEFTKRKEKKRKRRKKKIVKNLNEW